MVAGRQGQQRVWDLAERWLPAWAPTRRPPEREVVRLAAQRSLRALGVATARDIDRLFDLEKVEPKGLAPLRAEGVEVAEATAPAAVARPRPPPTPPSSRSWPR